VSLELQRRVKAAFDPECILNPGKVFASLEPNRKGARAT
jgi:FAD/FMN-containing dehydrogenase